MRKLAWLSGLFLVLTIPAAAQDFPKFEVFGGYSYDHRSVGGTGFGFNGGSTSFVYNPISLVGLKADFGAYHNSSFGTNTTTFTYLFGPQFTYRGNEHVTPFFHVLLGGAHQSSSFSNVSTSSSSTSANSASANAFAFAGGGGLDVHVSPHIAIRVAQVDYLLTKFKDDEDNRQNNVRVSAGIVFRWGK
jgi:opacity protein-like surface antigen